MIKPHKMLIACTIGWMTVFIQRLAYPPLMPLIKEEFDLTYLQVAFISTASMIAVGLGNPLGGYLADRYNPRNVILLSLSLMTGCSFLTGLAQTYSHFLLSQTVQGLMESLYYMAALVLLMTWFTHEASGRVTGILESGVGVGSFIIFSTAGLIAQWLNWRWVYFLAAGVGGISTILLWKFTRVNPERNRNPHSPFQWGIVRDPKVMALGVPFFFIFMMWFSVWTFIPTYLTDAKGLDLAAAGLIGGVALVLSIPSPALWGIAADRIGAKKVLMVLFSLISCALAALTFLPTVALTVIPILILGGTLTATIITALAYLVKKVPYETIGRTTGVILAIGVAGGAIGPSVLGYMADIISLQAGFLTLAAIAAMGTVFVWLKT